jgi:hypothetical protein
MFRFLRDTGLIFSAIFLCSTFVFAEDITITTYYPSPYGSYNSLQINKLGVGDNDGNTSLDAGDVPVNSGEVWIKGNVSIGKTSPEQALDVNGTVKATGFQAGTATGYSGTIRVRDSSGTAACNITVVSGIVTGETCS